MSKTSSRVKALLERTHQLQPSTSQISALPSASSLPLESETQARLPEPPPAIELPSFSCLIKTLRPVSPERGLDSSQDSRSASLTSLKPRKSRPTNLDGLITGYLKARKTAEKGLQALAQAADRLTTYLQSTLGPQFEAETSFNQRSEE
jgi:hypothetical protein